MFDQSLVHKAMGESQWRRDTALGRKVASNVTIGDCVEEYNRIMVIDEMRADAFEEHL